MDYRPISKSYEAWVVRTEDLETNMVTSSMNFFDKEEAENYFKILKDSTKGRERVVLSTTRIAKHKIPS